MLKFRNIGNLFSIAEKDLFKVDLETKCENINGKPKYIDISCGFIDKINCAIELKFKTAQQGAQDHGRIDAYRDIYALELVTEKLFNLGKFYMITNSTPYINQSKKGVGTVFATHNEHVTEKGKEFWYDWLIISCYTGQRVSDFMRFTKEQIRIEEGKHLIEFTQKKTGKNMTVPLHHKVLKILEKRNGEFPRPISSQKYNDYIKKVCAKA